MIYMKKLAHSSPLHKLILPVVFFFSAAVILGATIIGITRGTGGPTPVVDTQQHPLITDGSFDAQARRAWFLNEPVSPLGQPLPETAPKTVVLGETTDEKWIDVDLSTQTLRAMEGNRVIYEFKVSTGKWAPTPTGEFRIWTKLRYTKMSGGSQERHTYYYLPNVPYTMYFFQGYGIHGAYWHNNFGHPMSHGCINMSITDAQTVYFWANPVLADGKSSAQSTADNPGTRVVIHGEPPKSEVAF